MKSTVSSVGDNRVKLSVEVSEADLDRQIDAAFKRIAKQVRIRGFRPGKAPRRILEAQLGPEAGRQEALRTALPDYYAEAVVAHDVDVIDSPELEIVSGAEEGPLLFDAVVETRPVVNAGGYANLRVQVPSPEPTAEAVDSEVQSQLSAYAELVEVQRPAADGDHVTIDILAVHDDEEVPGLTTLSYDYEVGSGFMGGVLDENLREASAGDSLEFEAPHPDEDEPEPIRFEVEVHEVAEPVLPELDDAWVQSNTEFGTVEEYRSDIGERLRREGVLRCNLMLQPRMASELVKLVTDDVSETLVQQRAGEIVDGHLQRLQTEGHDPEAYLAESGQTRESLMATVKERAVTDVKFDLALRYVASQEELIPDDDALDDHLRDLAATQGERFDKLKTRLSKGGWLSELRAGLAKEAAGKWLVDNVELVDDDGNPVDREALQLPSLEPVAAGVLDSDEVSDGDDAAEADAAQADSADEADDAGSNEGDDAAAAEADPEETDREETA